MTLHEGIRYVTQISKIFKKIYIYSSPLQINSGRHSRVTNSFQENSFFFKPKTLLVMVFDGPQN